MHNSDTTLHISNPLGANHPLGNPSQNDHVALAKSQLDECCHLPIFVLDYNMLIYRDRIHPCMHVEIELLTCGILLKAELEIHYCMWNNLVNAYLFRCMFYFVD